MYNNMHHNESSENSVNVFLMKSKFLALIFCLLSFIGSSDSSCNGPISTSEYGALESIFISTHGNGWRWNLRDPDTTRWSFPNALDVPCSQHWQGLGCGVDSNNVSSCHVTSLVLWHYNLVGPLPEELGQLAWVEVVNLGNNFLISTLPTQLGQLSSISTLNITHNEITGLIPTELGNLSTMTILNLENNYLVGAIPSSFGYLPLLVSLKLVGNHLNGSMPTELGLLSNIVDLGLDNNCIGGTIPTEFGRLSSIITMNLDDNFLSGPIPSELGQLSTVQALNLYINNLSSTIPTELGLLGSVITLDASNNRLEGTVPTFLALLTAVEVLLFSVNSLHGSLPTELGLLPAVEVLDFYANSLTGTIPTELAQLTSLQSLYIYENSFVGTIPSEFGLLTSLNSLDISRNQLQGTLPTELGLLAAMQMMYVNNNCLTGTLPTELNNISGIEMLYLQDNHFHGSVPTLSNLRLLSIITLFDNMLTSQLPSSLLAAASQMQQLYIESNYFTGILPSLTNMSKLQVFNASANYFSGSVPAFSAAIVYAGLSSNMLIGRLGSGLAACSSVEYLDISDNDLTGPIPTYLASLGQLQSLNLSHNSFSQTIEGVFPATSNASLQLVDLSDNLLSGLLPESLFSLGSLHVVLLFENCFSGSLPDALCTNSNVQSLFLDRLTGNCGSIVPPSLRQVVKAAVPRHLIQGTIPSCLWDLPQLEVLHLSGNGLKGTLPDTVGMSSRLSVLVLPSNVLTGSLPSLLQTSGRFSQLDLSSNRLSGTLSAGFAVASNSTLLDLSVNRLSGRIPQAFENQSLPVNILNGNLFQCQAGNIPQQDPDHDGYVCGSDDLNSALEFAATGLVAAGMCMWWLLRCRVWMQTAAAARFEVLRGWQADVLRLAWVGCGQGLVSLILYISFKVAPSLRSFSTHSEQYMWTSTVAYLHGWAPLLVIVLLLAVAAAAWTSFEFWFESAKGAGNAGDPGGCDKQMPSHKWLRAVSVGLLHLLNLVVVVAVNAAYVNAVLQGLSRPRLFGIQLLLSVFKVGWSSLVIPFALRQVHESDGVTVSRTLMSLFSYIGGPFISTFFTSSNCFRNLFVGESSISSATSLLTFNCVDLCEGLCIGSNCHTACPHHCGFIQTETLSIGLTPPWLYSYQCSSSLVKDYVPVMISTFTISGAVLPLLQCLYFALPADILRALLTRVPEWVKKRLVYGSVLVADGEQVLISRRLRLVHTGNMRMKYLLNVAVLLTFGLACPLLAALIVVGSLIDAARDVLGVGRVVSMFEADSEGAGLVRDAVASNAVTRHAWELRMILLSTSMFWCIFAFDMVGDVYGAVAGAWAVIAPLLVPMAVFEVIKSSQGCEGASGIISLMLRLPASFFGIELTTMQPAISNPQSTDQKFAESVEEQ